MQQQITRGDYLEDLITIYIDNNLQQSLSELYSMFVFQCGEIQKQLIPASVIKISFTEEESKLLTNYNTCYLAGITADGHKETFNGSISFNTRGEVVYYEPTPNGSLQASTTSVNDCPCRGISGVFANCTQPAIKAYFSINYVPTKLSELENDTDFQDGLQVAESISIHNASTEAHPYIQGLIDAEASVRASETEALGIRIDEEVSVRASETEALSISIGAETTAREQAISLAISTTEGYADTLVQSATTAINTTIGDLSSLDTSVKSSVTSAINAEVSARQGADNDLQTQIDGLAAASDVTDIVGTYAELQAYDTQHLNDNDIIKVLSDSTHEDEPSYYRFDKETDTFSYIGSESAAYTKAQSNSIFVAQTTTVNGKALSSDISLTYSDVNALSDTYATTIAGNTSAIAANTTAIATNTSVIASQTTTLAEHTTAIASNTSDISTINGKIPTDASTTNKLVSASSLAASIADFANKDLNNLSTTGTQKLRSLNAYANEGELLTDADGLAFVKNYAHSTFDRSKFTVVGSPNITNDGILSNCSVGNYLQVPSTNIDLVNASTWEINIPAKLTNATTQYQMFFDSYQSNISSMIRLEYINNNNQNSLYLGIKANDGTDIFIIGNTVVKSNVALNTDYIIKIKFTGTQYIVTDDNGNILATQTNSKKCELGSFIRLGFRAANDYPLNAGSIDLKQFSITVDGVEVFSGNKTGIDTIKPNDYTVVGTPTISADGIVTKFGSDDFITIPVIDMSKPFTIDTKVLYDDSSSSRAFLVFSVGNTNATRMGLLFTINANNKLTFNTSSNGTSWEGEVAGTTTLIADNWYYVKLVYDGTSFTSYLSQDGITYNQEATVQRNAIYNGLTSYRIGRFSTGDSYFGGQIDLNAFKIYVDGNLVYQPCLKIPYTESKTGSKIVDSIYRDRVNDMANQFGYANYYTLSDTDFTLPQVELYGIIGQKTLRYSYENGINKVELYSNRDLTQQGSCTSGVEVTFARPFADTNYVLSVPYSAKSATAFTPTQTGDWIAKGKGLL